MEGGNRLWDAERQADLINDGLILKVITFRTDRAPEAAVMIYDIAGDRCSNDVWGRYHGGNGTGLLFRRSVRCRRETG